jgi:3-methylcrotonyl-CoA carboxylase alpha subunit
VQPPFRRVLIANRGEIAVRVIRACQELRAHAIAVYSEADEGALHTRLADEVHLLGPAPAAESYLSVERILDVARQAGAEAIHPGYGFLSENAGFAEACGSAGITFVGPPPAAMRLVGDKAAARRLAAREGVPVVPGYDGPEQEPPALLDRAREIGFPVMIKAAAGGGGRGMRIVDAEDELLEAAESARREATAAFGDGTLILERYVTAARHVEVQILGDHHGVVVHLGERECSIQRRHQKVVEESPSPACSPELRAALGGAAVRVARAAGYWNAGTCEFLLDAEGRFSFIEMNARLQVEHPVTEQVTGVDLVKLQLQIAAGHPLPLTQQDVALRGHALELRLYAEDPARDFLPSAGRLERFAPPLGNGLRHDVGVATGDRINTHYDAMLAKLIAFGEDRAAVLARARWALDHYAIEGVATNLPLLRWIVDHPDFVAGRATTELLARDWRPSVPEAPSGQACAAAAAHELASGRAGSAGSNSDPWAALGPWRLLDEGIPFAYDVAGAIQLVVARRATDAESATLGRTDGDAWSIAVADETFLATPGADATVTVHDGRARRRMDVVRRERDVLVTDRDTNASHVVQRAGPPGLDATTAQSASAGGPTRLTAPMPGRVVKVAAREGERVREHQALVVLEAMKIEHTVAAPRDGVVEAVHCDVGDSVDGGAPLVTVI